MNYVRLEVGSNQLRLHMIAGVSCTRDVESGTAIGLVTLNASTPLLATDGTKLKP